jgi:predicted membrane channel-forming protein YqfA (hemolysin III family)
MTICKCVSSAGIMHNETLNSWTHFLGGLYFLFQIMTICLDSGPNFKFKTRLSLILMLAGASSTIFSMFTSASYHLFNALGKN